MSVTEEGLFQPYRLSRFMLANRMVMAPMTRHRATIDGVPTALMVDYYQQRAGAGLIVTEGTYPAAMGRGYLFTPGICSRAQVTGWRDITRVVHDAGGHIFCQLMHCGRLSDPLILPDGADPIAPSAVQPRPDGLYTLNCPRPNRPYPTPRALSSAEVKEVIRGYADAASMAYEAGFDGIEIHAGNGYLPMQFFATNVNRRDDEYGGNVANRCRFMLELVDTVAAIDGADRIGVRLHPGQSFADVHDDDPQATYTFLASGLAKREIAYVHLSQRPVGWDVIAMFRSLFSGTIIGGGGLNLLSAQVALADGRFDLAAFGQAFLANPDLVDRYRAGQSVNKPELSTYYTQGAVGYTDYPVFAQRDPDQQSDAIVSFVSALQAERKPQPA